MGKAKPDYGQENIKPGDNTKFLRHEREVMRWDSVNIDDDDAVIERLEKYFDLCETNDMKPTVAGMAMSLKVSRETLWNWYSGHSRPGRSNKIKPYYELLSAVFEDYMMNHKLNPVSGIFLAKNNFGYEDKKEVVVKARQEFENPELSTDEIKKKYLESAGVIETTGEIVE